MMLSLVSMALSVNLAPKKDAPAPKRPDWEFAYPEGKGTVACTVHPTDVNGNPGDLTTVCKKEGGPEGFYGWHSSSGAGGVEVYRGNNITNVESQSVYSYIPQCIEQTGANGRTLVVKKESGPTSIYGFKDSESNGFDFVRTISSMLGITRTEEGMISRKKDGSTEYYVSHVRTIAGERKILDESSCSYGPEGELTALEGKCPQTVDEIPYRTK